MKYIFVFVCLFCVGCRAEKSNNNLYCNDCSNPEKIEQCETCLHQSKVELTFQEKPAREDRETIGIMETDISTYYPIAAFPDRFLNLFEFKEGQLHRWTPTLEIPASALAKLKAEISGLFPGGNPKESLLWNELMEGESQPWRNELFKHNAQVMSSLLINNPGNSIVAFKNFSLRDLFAWQDSCQANNFQDIFEIKLKSLLLQLGEILDHYNTRFINISTGVSKLEEVITKFRDQCKRDPDKNELNAVVHGYLKIIENISKDRLVFQSAPYTDQGLECLIDKGLKGYFLTGSWNQLHSGLDSDGYDMDFRNPERIRDEYDVRGYCAKINMNLNFDFFMQDIQHSFKATLLGIFSFQAANIPSTSLASPLALSYANYLRKVRFTDVVFDGNLIEVLENMFVTKKCNYLEDRKCIYRDPLKFGETLGVYENVISN